MFQKTPPPEKTKYGASGLGGLFNYKGEVKDGAKKAELPPTSSSLSVSSGFGDQFLKLSSDSSLVSTVKDTTDAKINSLLEVKIQSEVPHTQSPSLLSVHVSMISKPTVLTPKIDLSAEALAALKTQAPSVVDKYLGSKVGDVFQKELKKHTADLIQKYSLHQIPELPKKQIPTVDLEQGSENKLRSNKRRSLLSSQQTRKLFKKDENRVDNEVVDIGKKTKRRRTKQSESSKKPSTTKETPKGRASSKGSKTGKHASTKEPVKEPIAKVVIDDMGDDVVHDEDQPQDASEPKTAKTLNSEWFTQPPRPPTPDPEWNKRQVVLDQPEQPWFKWSLLQRILLHSTTSWLPQLISPSTCSSSIELEYHFQECFNTLTDKLDWNNPEGDPHPFDLSKPLSLQGHLGHLTIAVDYFFNNDLEYLKSFDPERTYTTSITKTKAARYEIEGIEDMVPTLWSPTKVGYGHLEEIMVKRAYRQFYKFKEGDFVDLHMKDIKDMLLLAVQHKLFHLTGSDIVDFIVALRMFTRSLVIKKRVEDLQLGVESYQKKLNITPPQQTVPEIEFKELYTPSHKPPGVIYEDLTKQKIVMQADELYKFSDKTLKKVRDELHHRIRDFRLEYNTDMPRRKWTAIDRIRSKLMVELIDKQMRERRIIRNLERLVGTRELEMDYCHTPKRGLDGVHVSGGVTS
ncbi:hypothetical protein Tco_0784751 [Tanacetum coccineum]